MQPLFDKICRRQRSGFTASRSTIDAVLDRRLLSELHREFERFLNVVHLNIKAAFDSADHIALYRRLYALMAFLTCFN